MKEKIRHKWRQTFALPCLTQRIPNFDPALVWIILTRSGPDNCWITSAADVFKETWIRKKKKERWIRKKKNLGADRMHLKRKLINLKQNLVCEAHQDLISNAEVFQ